MAAADIANIALEPAAPAQSEDRRVLLQWENLSYSVKVKHGKEWTEKKILQNLAGKAEPGKLTAIIGPSGAGKTSLLNLLSRQIVQTETDLISGSIKLNGMEHVSEDTFRRFTSFCAQDDILLGSLTPRESLTFAANLLLAGLSEEERSAKVESILDSLGLQNSADTIVGFDGAAATNSSLKRGISGGEKKRASIGVSLITDPKLFMLDEPTSGLDAFAARAVVELLKQIAAQGTTVICTIHQPSAEIFSMFDNLLVLADGRTAFFGEPMKAIKHFEALGFPLPANRNPADHMMRVLHAGGKGAERSAENEEGSKSEEAEQVDQDEFDDPEEEDEAAEEGNDGGDFKHSAAAMAGQVDRLVSEFAASEYAVKASTPSCSIPPALEGPNAPAYMSQHVQAATWMNQFKLVYKRCFLHNFREPLLFKVRFGQSIFLAIICGLIYFNLGRDQVGIRDRLAALFFLSVNAAFSSINGPVYLFPSEIAIFVREYSAGFYSPSSYFLGKIASELPANVLTPIIFSSIVYYMVGFNSTGAAFVSFMFLTLLLTNVTFALGVLLSCAIKKVAVAIQILPAIMVPFIVFSGFYLNSENVPKYFIWWEALSIIKYGLRALANNELQGAVFTCKSDQFVGNGTCPLTTGAQVAQLYSFDQGNDGVWSDAVILIGFMVFFYVSAFFLLRKRALK